MIPNVPYQDRKAVYSNASKVATLYGNVLLSKVGLK